MESCDIVKDKEVKLELSKDALNEDFIIVENPDYEIKPSAIFFSGQVKAGLNPQEPIRVEHDILPSPLQRLEPIGVENNSLPPPQTVDSIRRENDILPPPRTLDDPLKRQKRKVKAYKRKDPNYHKISATSKNYNPSSQSEDLSLLEQDNSKESDGRNPITSFPEKVPNKCSLKNNVSSTEKEDPDKSEKNSSKDIFLSYNLRKKSIKIDYNLESLENIVGSHREIFNCSQCDYSFASGKELKNHQVSFHLHKSFKCETCENGFSSAFGLKRHIYLKHKMTKCPCCKKQFSSGRELLSHKRTCGIIATMSSTNLPKGGLLQRSSLPKPPQTKKFPCPTCGKKFTVRSNLRRHVKLHSGILKFTCEHCGKKCSEKQALQSHIRYKHSGERPYKCLLCPKSFATISDKNRHQSVHSEERKFTCSDCGKGFKNRDALKAHMRLKNSEKLWQCGVCQNRFATKMGLKTHMVIHSSIKKYECETCQKKFSHLASLQAHTRSHTGLMPYQCPHCGKKFSHYQNRNRHVKTVHKDINKESLI